MSVDLKPCPFCGTHLIEAEFLSTRVAKCYVHPPAAGGEICHAEHTVVWSDKADVWNRRAADGPEPIRYWERTEQAGERSSRILVDLVGRSIADIDVLYINDDAYVPADRHRTVVDEYAEFVKQHEKEVASLSASIPAGLDAVDMDMIQRGDRLGPELGAKVASAILSLSAELERAIEERDDARRSNREARAIISATHKRAVTHQNCQCHSCPICEGGLFQCADCGAAEIETEQRVCTCRAAEAKLAGGEAEQTAILYSAEIGIADDKPKVIGRFPLSALTHPAPTHEDEPPLEVTEAMVDTFKRNYRMHLGDGKSPIDFKVEERKAVRVALEAVLRGDAS